MKHLTLAPFLRGLRSHVRTLDGLAKWENGELTGEILDMSPAHMQSAMVLMRAEILRLQEQIENLKHCTS